MKRVTDGILLSILIILLCGYTSEAQSPIGWRGPERDGVYPEKGLLKNWPSAGPELIWEVMDAGSGYSSPVVAGDRIFVTGLTKNQSQEILSAYTLDGKKVFTTTYGTSWNKSYPGTRTTPTINGDRAYMISGGAQVACINTDNGQIVWKVDGGEVFERRPSTWGTSESPLVYDNKVIYSPGGNQTTIVALNAETGKVIWKSRPLRNRSSYVSPILISYNGKKQIIGMTEHQVTGVDPDNGDIEWTFSDWGQRAVYKISPNTPLYQNGQLFVCQGYNIGSFKLQLNSDLTGVKVLWRNDDLDTHHGGFVLVNGVIYGSNWINNSLGKWVAIDWTTGKTIYEDSWTGGKSKGSIITADNRLYCYDERRGTVGLVKPNRERFEVISEFRITKGDGPHWSHPVIKDGVLYIRHGKALMAYRIR